jgi:hypothetical protein
VIAMTESPATAGRAESTAALWWMLRAGVALCFLGHGAFGLMTKAAWVPYFAAAGVPESWAWRLMPWIGAMDVTVACLALLWPCRALFAWAAAWATWTALLRPMAGQGWPEFFERAGNYGVPLAVLVIAGLRGPWFARLPAWPEMSVAVRRRLHLVLRLSLASLLAGHAACALLLQKPMLAHHYAVFGPADPVRVMLAVGWFEAVIAFAVLVVRVPALLVFACLWKLATESLFFTSGAPAPVFEIIERGGSYVVPLALAYLLTRSTAVVPFRQPQPA